VGREKKGQAAFSPLVFLRGPEVVGQTCLRQASLERKDFPCEPAERVRIRGGLEWKGCATSAGAWLVRQLRLRNNFGNDYFSITKF